MSWPIVPLGSVVKIKGGGTPDKTVDAYWNGPIPWASVKDFKATELSATGDTITQAGLDNSASTLVPAGTIIVPTRMAVGKAAIAKIDLAINQDLKALFPEGGVDTRYLLHLLLSSAEKLVRLATGATVKGITLDVLRSLEVPLPPLTEQRRIAAILDQADAIRSLRRQSVERITSLGISLFYTMFGDPATNPKGFRRATLGDIINFEGGSQPPKSTFLYEDGPDRVRLVQIRDFRSDKYKTYVPSRFARRPFSKSDVMIGRYGPPVFQIFRGLSGTYNVALMKAKPVEGVSEDFVFYLLQEPRLHGFVVANSERTAGQSGVNLDLLEAYPAFRPPADVQNAFSSRIQMIDRARNRLATAWRESDTLFASLQHRAFRGEL